MKINILILITCFHSVVNKLVQKYEDKLIINPYAKNNPINHYYNLSEFKKLLDITKVRLDNTKHKLIELIAERNDNLYESSDLAISGAYPSSYNYMINILDTKLDKSFATCNKLDPNSKLMTPLSTDDFEKFGKLLKSLDVTGQPLHVIKSGLGLISIDTEDIIVQEPTAGRIYSDYVVTVSQSGTIQSTTKADADTDAKIICLSPLRDYRINSYELNKYKTNSEIYLNLLKELEVEITEFKSHSSDITAPSDILTKNFPLSSEFYYLTKCLKPWNLDNIITDPTDHCLDKIREIAEYLHKFNNVINNDAKVLVDNYNQINLNLFSNNIIEYTYLNPTNMEVDFYEFTLDHSADAIIDVKYVFIL